MRTLKPNIANRVRKLPKPANHTQALQPLFEAVSNSFFAIEDRFSSAKLNFGRINIDITGLNDSRAIKIVIADNGIGLDEDRFEAFCTIDTDFKQPRGGKGVGRLFWLDAFENISVASVFSEDDKPKKRSFTFHLRNDAQIETVTEKRTSRNAEIGTAVTFQGLRDNDYAARFPRRADTFLRYFGAHFIADFLVGSGPRVTVSINGAKVEYPKEISDLVVGSALDTEVFDHPDFGLLRVVGYTCRPEASTGLDGSHQLHLLANGRTVETRSVDNLLALKSVEREGHADLVFHGCVSGPYLDDRVNEGRTGFTLPESELKTIARHCVDVVKQRLLPDQIAAFAAQRRSSYEHFVRRYPIYGFDDSETQLNRVPFHATEPEDFAAGLVKYQIRRDEKRQDTLEGIIKMLEQSEGVPDSFEKTVELAAREIQDSERLALAQHVVRRKLVLELLEQLIKRVRTSSAKADDHHLEATLHSLICPMRIRGDNPKTVQSAAHDLWIVDERFAFTRAFASDMRLDALLKSGGGAARPDLVLWDLAFGMGVADPYDEPDFVNITEPLSKVLIVEFKRPGRREYGKPEDQIEQQITKYLSQLQSGEIESFGRDRVRIAADCIFYCYVVADIVGDLELQLSNWEKTANGQGRIRSLTNQYRGSIEVVQWRDLVNDAWMRNSATLCAAGLSRFKPFQFPN